MMRVFAAVFAFTIAALGQEERPPTFSRDVAPLLNAKCVACHQLDGLAPFALTTYADARAKAGKMARMVLGALMPPWLPARDGFADSRRLNLQEVALLRRWIEAGAPEGDPLQPATGSKPEWQLGQPDRVFTLPAPHVVPANGRIQTVHFVFPLGDTAERHLRAVEVLPGNARVVLQANVFFDRSGRARELAGETGWYERFGGPGFFPAGQLAGYFPGEPPRALPPGVTLKLAPETDLVLQVRYRATEKQEIDFSRVALFFAPEAGKHLTGRALGNESLRIAPRAEEVTVTDSITITAPLLAHEIRPNLLQFGRAVKAWAELPDGKKRLLLEIHDWDFTWQETYRFQEPIALPKGTKIVAEWVISNDSDRELRVGDLVTDEAPGLWIGGSVDEWSQHVAHVGANLAHLTALMEAARQRK